MDLRCRRPSLSFHRRLRRRDSLLPRQKTSFAHRMPHSLRSYLRRTGISVYVLRGNPAFSYRSSSVQPRYLHYRPDWPSASGRIAHRFFRPPPFGGVEAAVSAAMQVFCSAAWQNKLLIYESPFISLLSRRDPSPCSSLSPL